MSIDKHPNVLSTKTVQQIDGVITPEGIKTALLIRTDLALSEDDPNHDQKAFGDFMNAVSEFLRTHNSYDSVVIEQVDR